MTQSPKKAAQETLGLLPDDAGWDQIMYALYVRQKIEHALADVVEGGVFSHEEVRRQLLGPSDA